MGVFVSPNDDRVVKLKSEGVTSWRKVAYAIAEECYGDKAPERLSELADANTVEGDPEFDKIELVSRPMTPNLRVAIRKAISRESGAGGDVLAGMYEVARMTLKGWRVRPGVSDPPELPDFKAGKYRPKTLDAVVEAPNEETLGHLSIEALEQYVAEVMRSESELTEQDEKN